MTTGTIADRLAAGAPAVGVDESARPAAASRKKVRSNPAASKVVGKVADAARTAGADLRSAWWTPASLPTLQRAWAERMPDRETVPGGNEALYRGWVAYNHTIGLAVPAVAVLVVGLLTPLVWAARHPARLGLAIALLTPLIVLLAQ